jgi:hypothetical protein
LASLSERIEKDVGKSVRSIEESLIKEQLASTLTAFLTLPEQRMADADILNELQVASQLGHFKYQDGKLSGRVLESFFVAYSSSFR